MTFTARLPFRPAATVATLLLAVTVAPLSAHADFFDDMRQTFKSDIPHFFQNDVPHFFQDDIPCAFGGRPTSGTKQSCRPSDRPSTSSADKDHRVAPLDKNTTHGIQPATNDSKKSGGKSPSSEKAVNGSASATKPVREHEGGALPSSDKTTNGSSETAKALGDKDVGANGASGDQR